MLALGIYCGAAWAFMIFTLCIVPGRKDWTDYAMTIFAPLSIIAITAYELIQLTKKKHL